MANKPKMPAKPKFAQTQPKNAKAEKRLEKQESDRIKKSY